jgi:predicted transcriptional regulator
MTNERERLLAFLAALDNPLRLKVVVELAQGRLHVSELARRVGISRPLLYMHLEKLVDGGIVTSKLELAEDGKAMKYYELKPFDVRLTPQSIAKRMAEEK